jgi:hypothetical protein
MLIGLAAMLVAVIAKPARVWVTQRLPALRPADGALPAAALRCRDILVWRSGGMLRTRR